MEINLGNAEGIKQYNVIKDCCNSRLCSQKGKYSAIIKLDRFELVIELCNKHYLEYLNLLKYKK